MTILFYPTLKCNLGCLYCFLRGSPSLPCGEKIDWDRVSNTLNYIRDALNAKGSTIVLHGGEPTTLDINLLERVIRFIRSHGFKVSLQSNIYNITESHIELFKKYGVSVGASIDGFPDINVLRGFFDGKGRELKRESEKYRRKVMDNLEMLVSSGVCNGVISLLHRGNVGSGKRLERFKAFIKWLVEIGVTSIRLNPMFATTGAAEKYELSNAELARVLVELYDFTRVFGVHCSPFTDVRRLLMGRRDVVCWFLGCHYYDSFVWSIDAKGNILSCDRTLKDGVWLRPSQLPHTHMFRVQARTYALLQTELRNDRFAHLHRGGCPAEAVGDWRRPSRFVPAFVKLFEHAERDIKSIMPDVHLASEYPDRIEYVRMIDAGYNYDVWNGGFSK